MKLTEEMLTVAEIARSHRKDYGPFRNRAEMYGVVTFDVDSLRVALFSADSGEVLKAFRFLAATAMRAAAELAEDEEVRSGEHERAEPPTDPAPEIDEYGYEVAR